MPTISGLDDPKFAHIRFIVPGIPDANGVCLTGAKMWIEEKWERQYINEPIADILKRAVAHINEYGVTYLDPNEM